MSQTRLSILWALRLGLGFVGFLAGVILFFTLLLTPRGDPGDVGEVAVLVAYTTLLLTIPAVIFIELLRGLYLFLMFIGRKTGLLNHSP
jgi:hypothetical protein